MHVKAILSFLLLFASSIACLGFGLISLKSFPLLSQSIYNVRDIRFTQKDQLTGEYKGCLLDCGSKPDFYYFTWNKTDLVLQKKVLFTVKDTSYDLRWITAIESCQFAGAEILSALIGDMDTNVTIVAAIGVEKVFPVNTFSVSTDSQVITYMLDKSFSSYEGDMIRRIVNGTEIAFYYDSSLDTVPGGIMQFSVYQTEPTEYYLLRAVTTPESTIFPAFEFGLDAVKVIVDKCVGTDCTELLVQQDTIGSTLLANSTSWYFCGRAVILNNTHALASSFYCISSQDPGTRVPVPVPSYFGSSFDLDLIAYEETHSVMMGDGTIVLAVADQLGSRYNLFALDPTNFNVKTTKQSTRNGGLVSMTTYDGYIVVGTDSSIDFWELGNYSDPNPSPNPAEPATGATPTDTTSPSNAPTAAIITPPPPVDGLAVGLGVSLSVAGAVGIFLIIYFLVIKKRMDQKKNQNGDAETGGDSHYTVMPLKPESSSTIDEKLQIPYKQLKFSKEIGSGSFGKVYYGKWKGAEVAIKMSTQLMQQDVFLKEAKLTVDLPPHPNVVRTFGVCLDSEFPYIVLEFCDGGSLDTVFSKQRLNVEEQKAVIKGVAFGLLHLHSHNIVHRDLAARNILLGNGKPKISDFGMSRVLKDMSQQGQTETNIGPVRWMAPESLQDLAYSAKSDVWTFGIVMSEIVNGHEPHLGEDQLDVAAKIRDEAFTPSIPPDCDPALREIMEKCWKSNPDERPTMYDLCQLISHNF